MKIDLPPSLAIANIFDPVDYPTLQTMTTLANGQIILNAPSLSQFTAFCQSKAIDLIISPATRDAYNTIITVAVSPTYNDQFLVRFNGMYEPTVTRDKRWLRIASKTRNVHRWEYIVTNLYQMFLAHRVLHDAGYILQYDPSLHWIADIVPGQSLTRFQQFVTPKSHQADTLHQFFTLSEESGLIGDDAGLGKTTSAGMILKQLFDAGKIHRGLWVVPSDPLAKQIAYELKRFFNVDAFVVTGETTKPAKRYGIKGTSVYLEHGFCVTTWGTFVTDWGAKNYAKVRQFAFDFIVVDECFPGNTPITISDGTCKAIDQIKASDIVKTPLGNKRVLRVIKNIKQSPLIEIIHERGSLKCTPNHKIFCNDGFIKADELTVNDELIYDDANVPAMSNGVCSKEIETAILLKEMRRTFNQKRIRNRMSMVPYRNYKQCQKSALLLKTMQKSRFWHSRSSCKSIGTNAQSNDGSQIQLKKISIIANDIEQPIIQSRDTEKNIGIDEGQTFHTSWGQWQNSRATKNIIREAFTIGCELENGMCRWHQANGKTLPIKLQTGHWQQTYKIRNRNRWHESSQYNKEKTAGSEERIETIINGMASNPILERANLNRIRSRIATNQRSRIIAIRNVEAAAITYNLEVEDAHCYYANNILVSNCHRIKYGNASYDAMMNFRGTYRIGLTGTPSPNGSWRELYSVLYALNPFLVRPIYEYNAQYQKLVENFTAHPIMGKYGYEAPEDTAERVMDKSVIKELRPLVIRHTKAQVNEGLPTIAELQLPISMTDGENVLWDDVVALYASTQELRRSIRDDTQVEACSDMVWQDMRRLGCFGKPEFEYRLDEYFRSDKPVYTILRKQFNDMLLTIRKDIRKTGKDGVRDYPKFSAVTHYLKKDHSDHVLLFCNSVMTAIRLAEHLHDHGYDTRVITGEDDDLKTIPEVFTKLHQRGKMSEDETQEIIAWFWSPYKDLSDIREHLDELHLDLTYWVDASERPTASYVDLLGATFIEIHASWASKPSPDHIAWIARVSKLIKDVDAHADISLTSTSWSLKFRPQITTHKRILVTTDRLSEGCNLQIASTVMHFDYPESIRKYEQRIARSQRMGSPYRSIAVVAAMSRMDRALQSSLQEKYSHVIDMGFAKAPTVSHAELLRSMKKMRDSESTASDPQRTLLEFIPQKASK